MVYPQVVTHQLQVERRTGKARRLKTDVLPLCYATRGYAMEFRGGFLRQLLVDIAVCIDPISGLLPINLWDLTVIA